MMGIMLVLMEWVVLLPKEKIKIVKYLLVRVVKYVNNVIVDTIGMLGRNSVQLLTSCVRLQIRRLELVYRVGPDMGWRKGNVL